MIKMLFIFNKLIKMDSFTVTTYDIVIFFKWSDIVWLRDIYLNSTNVIDFCCCQFCIIKIFICIFDKFDWKKKINMHSIIICLQTNRTSYKRNIIDITSIFISKGTIFGIQKLYNTDE